MKILIFIFLISITVIFITLYVLLSEEVKNIAGQLNKINGVKTNSRILLSFKNKNLGKLALEINKTLEEKKKIEIEYKKMDIELRQAISNMSHDLRTPLTSIMGYIQLIEDSSLLEEERKEYINIVKKRAKSLQVLISGFYDLSRLEAKEYKFEFKSMNLSNIICDMIASFYNDFLSRGIEPAIDIDQKLQLIVGDENAIRRVFSNLIQNMLKYGEKNVFISLKSQDDFVIAVFKNDAPNLKDEDVSHLFERFFIGDRTRNGDSTGLGLAITKELVEQMGYKIEAGMFEGKLSIAVKFKAGV
ncbi:sensor histidine kinase [Clostridium thailandense]|uniref:sensor histidine kinase n=1 Tax=Clostridium thailandense TaxID=2794346 RepID=UPI0039894B30